MAEFYTRKRFRKFRSELKPTTPRELRSFAVNNSQTILIEPPIKVRGPEMSSKFVKHVDRDEIVRIVCELVRQNTVNPPGNEYLCKDIVTECMRSLGMEISYYEKEPGRTNIVGRIGTGSKSIGFVSHMDVVPPGELDQWNTPPFEPTIKTAVSRTRPLDDRVVRLRFQMQGFPLSVEF